MHKKVKFSHRSDGQVVRRPSMMASALIGVTGLAIMLAFSVVHTPTRLEYVEGAGVSAVTAMVVLIIWVIAWSSTFIITEDALEIRTFIFVEAIPWSRVVKVDLLSGVTVHLDDKSQRDSLQFGDSLLGSLTGQPTYKPAVAKLEAARMHYQSMPQTTENNEEITSRVELHLLEAVALLVLYIPVAMAAMYFFQ